MVQDFSLTHYCPTYIAYYCSNELGRVFLEDLEDVYTA